MSTRSGKRLHNSSNENIEPEHTSKRDKKMRNKRAVENGDVQEVLLKPKKRQNYVSFPTDELLEPENGNPVENEVQVKQIRALRRNTLKEHNAATDEVETTKKLMRTTRSTKKFSETATDEVLDVPENENQVEIVTISNSKPKGKKNKKKSKKSEQPVIINQENDGELVKKKTSKKKKNSKSNSLIIVQEEICALKRKNDSSASTDSFHSAAGSPIHKDIVSPINKSSPKSEAEALPLHNINKNKTRRSSLKRTSLLNTSTTVSMEVDGDINTNIDKQTDIVAVTASKHRRSSLKDIMPDKDSTLTDTIDKVDLNATFEKEPSEISKKQKRKSNMAVENTGITAIRNTSSNSNAPKTSNAILNITFEKEDTENGEKNKKSTKKINKEINEISTNKSLNASFENRRSPRKSSNVSEKTTPLNGTFDLSPTPDLTKQKSLDSTFDKESKLNSTFDKTTPKHSSSSKSSLISSDATNSSIVTLDKSDELSKLSITDDDSKIENILNTTPLLIESSMEESKVLESVSKKSKTQESKPATTPLKREGTFTKDDPAVSMSPKLTPSKRQTLPTAGCTPYHSNGKSSQKRSVLNLTHSIEKPRRSTPAEPRATRVMFCSPVNNPGVATLRKTKVIKSNLKGSNKSFVFDESMSSLLTQRERSARKRSLTQAEGEPAAAAAAKRSRLALPLPLPPAPALATPAERRARASSQPAKPSTAATPTKTPTKVTPSKPRSEVKATKLPNFAALHARRFERMESLDECQRRRARRARGLLVPAGGLGVLERGSPRVTLENKARDTPPKAATPAQPSKLPTLDTLQRGYTRFGFKMQCDVNPFSVPFKPADKPKETKPNGVKPNGVKPDSVKPNGIKSDGVKPNVPKKPVISLTRQIKPSLVGATSLRKEAAKQSVMREKSFTLAERRQETRQEVRTVIKGVRTNRRFDLQMKSRNING